MADPITGAISLGLGIAGNAYNYYQSSLAEKRLQKQLEVLGKQPLPTNKVDPAWGRFYQQATSQAASPQGFTGAEVGNFQQGLARTLATQRANATQMSGGNLGRALNAMNVGANVGALNSFAGQDASLRRQNQNQAYGRQAQAAGVFQNVGNMNTQLAWQRRLMQEQALGTSLRQQRDYQRNILGGASQDLLGAGAMGLLGYTQPTGQQYDFRGVRGSRTGNVPEAFLFND